MPRLPTWLSLALVGALAVAVVVIALLLNGDGDSAKNGSSPSSSTILGGGPNQQKTFEGDGYSFSYPRKWVKARNGEKQGGGFITAFAPDGEIAAADAAALGADVLAAFAPGDDALALIAEREEPLGEQEWDSYMEYRRKLLEENGELLERPTRVTVGGLPALRSVVDLGDGVALQETIIFNDTVGMAYFLECRFSSDEMERGCDQAKETFEVE
jgi:hypothetical protein